MEKSPFTPSSGPAGAEAGSPSWPPIAGDEETAVPIPVSDVSPASVAPASSPQPEVLSGEVFAPGDKGYEPQAVDSGNASLALPAGQGAETINQNLEAERGERVQRAGAALARIIDNGLEVAGELDKTGILGVVSDLTQGAQSKSGRVLHAVVTATRAAAKVDEVRQQGRNPERDDDVVFEEIFDVPPRQGNSGFVDARYVEPEPTTPPRTHPDATPPRSSRTTPPPSGFWPPVSRGSTTSPAAPTPAPEAKGKEDTPPDDDKATAPPPPPAEPEPGRAETKVKYQKWQLDNFALLDRLEALGIHPNLGLPIDLGAVLADEGTSQKWRQRAEWMARSKETEGGTVEWNGRTYNRQLPYVGPDAQLASPFTPAGPPVRTGKPEDRSLEDQKDYGKGRLTLGELWDRGLRRVAHGPDIEPGGRIAGRRWRRAREAGFGELDAGDGLSDAEVRAHQEKSGYLHLDPNGPPVTAVEGGPWEASTEYRKLRFDPRRARGRGYDDHPSRRRS